MTKLTFLVAVATALLLAPAAVSAQSIAVCNGASPAPACAGGPFTSTSGVYFEVTAGGGNRDFTSVGVRCDSGYATVLTVAVPPKGTGYSQTIHPPGGSNCTATLEKLQQGGKVQVLAGPIPFVVQ